ncbi:unnamed protein product [Candida verbasci]|uniref:tRNA (guanine(10)-N(2))-methyltransferase n=1 Tax=Candida verbasci TaxID=1227364 RepID=A0A9W4XAV6_9ASCO|nr:unnamed protein product [Candida verbasci]
MKQYLIYFAQSFPNFRRAELESLADLYNIPLHVSHCSEDSPFLIVDLENDDQAKKLIHRSILTRSIYELWGYGKNYNELHSSVKTKCNEFDKYKNVSFKFDFESFKGGVKSNNAKAELIESFSYLAFEGKIDLKNPQEIFTVLEEYRPHGMEIAEIPINLWFGRLIQTSARQNKIVEKYDLKKRKYIGTTSFESELSLITCNLGQVQPGKLTYDPFTGTGSFLVTAAYFGALVIGSDIDVRMLQGKKNCNIISNFKQYNTLDKFIDVLTMDFTHNALRCNFSIDNIICDPPYGVREGLRVLGAKNPEKAEGRKNNVINGEIAYLRRDFIPPKKPYQLSSLLDDLLNFANNRLPIGGRLAFWMPTANDDFQEHLIPQHEKLELLYCLEQEFQKWSRRLLVYVKRNENYIGITSNGLKTENIKQFRDRYFKGFSERSR